MFYFGVDYYPEHWPEERWETDARLMKEAGINVVRLAEFAWSLIEVHDGFFDFDWLDRAISILTDYDIQIVLGTPTAAVPPWLWEKIPDLALVDSTGTALEYGSRRDCSPTNVSYRFYAQRIAQRMAEHYKDHPSVIGWQIDNEFGDRCYSAGTRREFQQWLKAKYQTLDELNACWGTRFWSQMYTDWSQIPVPVSKIHGKHNPSLHLEYFRFISDAYVEFQQIQIDTIRKLCPPRQFVTHNIIGFWYPHINYFDLAAPLDFISWDNYPRGFWVQSEKIDPAPLALSHTLAHSLKKKNFWVMEQQSGHAAWDIIPPVPRPGEIAIWAYQAIAQGADGVVFFRWRTNRHGSEQYWHGVLDHDGQPRRRYHEIKQMGEQVKRLGSTLVNSEKRANVAIMHSYDTRFAFQIQPNNRDFSYEEHTLDYFRACYSRNIAVDIVSQTEDMSQYKLLIIPALYVLEDETAQRINDFATNGGTVIITARSGVKDHYNAVVNEKLPGLLADLCGVEVDEYDSLLPGMVRNINFISDEGYSRGKASIWCDILQPTGASVLAQYDEDFYSGRPAVTVKTVGQGNVVYVGTMGNRDFVDSITQYSLKLAEVKSPLETPTHIEVTERWQGEKRLLFVLNHSDLPEQIHLDTTYRDLITDTVHSGMITLASKQVLILQ